MRNTVDETSLRVIHLADMKAKQRTRRVLVMLNQTLKAARDEISGILRGASDEAWLDVRVFDRNLPPEALRERISAWVPDGIILDNRGSVPTLLPGAVPNCLTFRLARTVDIPVVYLDFSCPTASSVGIDNAAIGKTAAQFFLRRRYEHFAFVGTDLAHTARHSQARAAAFADVLAEQGFPCAHFEIDERHPERWTDELERLRGWIDALPKPCAVLTHADVYAQLVTDACRLAKVSIPEQVALLGVDNEVDIADNLRPTLSSVLPDFVSAGVQAVQTLVKLMNARRTPRKPIRATYGVKALIERGSTQDVRGAGRLVDAARKLIRTRSHEGIRVADIARELNVSPRLLELHFRSVLGHSVRDELLDTRLEEVKSRLTRTKEPIDVLALQCGWRSAIALKVLFKKRCGQSMRDYRKARLGK